MRGGLLPQLAPACLCGLTVEPYLSFSGAQTLRACLLSDGVLLLLSVVMFFPAPFFSTHTVNLGRTVLSWSEIAHYRNMIIRSLLRMCLSLEVGAVEEGPSELILQGVDTVTSTWKDRTGPAQAEVRSRLYV